MHTAITSLELPLNEGTLTSNELVLRADEAKANGQKKNRVTVRQCIWKASGWTI